MAKIVVAILDRDDWQANTDIIVIADGARRSLTWIPRDLWSRRLRDRVNMAFRIGGCGELVATLAELGFRCDGAVCLRRGAAEAALGSVDIAVPVGERLEFWYPLEPTRPIEEGRKRIVFEPPEARLQGERVHQWIGARKVIGGNAGDLNRLERQRILLKALLGAGFDFGPAWRDRELIRSAGEDAAETLRQIDAGWRMRIFRDVLDARIDDKAVLVRASLPRRLWRRVLRRIRRTFAKKSASPRPVIPAPPSTMADGSGIAWGARVSPPFKDKLIAICGRLQLEPNALMAVIAFETARTFSPAVRNKLSGATGLIQFTPGTAIALGTTTEALAAMTDVEQLDYVERYLNPYAGRMSDISDAYMAVLWPDAVGEPASHVLFAAPSGAYERNRGLDADGDGRVTKSEATAPVMRFLDEGLAPGNLG